ncbi:hypothetical protein K505DRAFT_416060 [Melanomma pulvis-pyrius CBS 109.77]|uniref:Zn(2)-C6 fungal-type domain-containing protein n=1 Tax=Melanomma pulvis-pyrius CBS 109.77 TaxID=1314802 RepID=A0A6A6XJG3_9PLEO|nr:hypothetical protein K505DRAFT_416060 [Melanomma pulvis-pyrius CBS 109.77]
MARNASRTRSATDDTKDDCLDQGSLLPSQFACSYRAHISLVIRRWQMGLPREKRRRAYKPKRTTGCITCKNSHQTRIRRVKCDEAKPDCYRCTSTGRKCDGYAPSSSSPPLPPCNKLEFIPGLFHRALSLRPQLQSAEEHESFHFFENQAILELPGFFTSSFWQREVLQAAKCQPAIRYAVMALGAMHRRYITGTTMAGDSSDKQLAFALRQSNRAIKEILAHGSTVGTSKISKADRVTIMTTCVLFNCMACLQGHLKEALQHLRGGIKLLREVDDEAKGEIETDREQAVHPVTLNSLRRIFIGLDVQARSIMRRDELLTWEPVPRHQLSASLSTIEDVQLFLEGTLNDFLAFVQEMQPGKPVVDLEIIKHTFYHLKAQAEEGGKVLDQIFSRPSTGADEQRSQCFVALRLLRTVVNLALRAFEFKMWGPQEDYTALEGNAKFVSMMDLISTLVGPSESNSPSPSSSPTLENRGAGLRTSALVNCWQDEHLEVSDRLTEPESPVHEGNTKRWISQTPPPSPKRPVFSFTFGVLAALWWVAQQASTPALRLRAIHMMMEHPRREGFWDGPIAGRIAWEALVLEQASAKEELGEDIAFGEEVPEFLRIRNVDIEYLGTTGAKVEYKNVRATEKGDRGWVRFITW